MRKTVIVFSTRYISPLVQEGLFSEGNFNNEPKPFSSVLLANYFWDDIINFTTHNSDTEKEKVKKENYFKTILNDQYFKKNKLMELLSLGQGRRDFIQLVSKLAFYSKKCDENTNAINDLIRQYSPTTIITKNNYDWVRELILDLTPELQTEWKWLLELFQHWDRYYGTVKTKILTKNGQWVSKRLNNEATLNQKPPQNLDNGNIEKPGPWLAYRFSYYQHNMSDECVAVYAVWPLNYPSEKNEDGKYQWIEALTDQFLRINPDVEDLYLVLHDEDIEQTIFKVLDEDKGEVKIDSTTTVTAKRHIALFQHVDRMGTFLKNPPIDIDSKGILDFVKQMLIHERQRILLCNAYDYFENNDIDQLSKSTDELFSLDSNNYNDIHTTVSELKNDSSKSDDVLVELKKKLITLLNQRLQDVLIENNPNN